MSNKGSDFYVLDTGIVKPEQLETELEPIYLNPGKLGMLVSIFIIIILIIILLLFMSQIKPKEAFVNYDRFNGISGRPRVKPGKYKSVEVGIRPEDRTKAVIKIKDIQLKLITKSHQVIPLGDGWLVSKTNYEKKYDIRSADPISDFIMEIPVEGFSKDQRDNSNLYVVLEDNNGQRFEFPYAEPKKVTV